MARNLWFEQVIDAYLRAVALGEDWKAAVAEAEQSIVDDEFVRVLTREDLKAKKGIPFSRQYLNHKVREGTFPPPFNAPFLNLEAKQKREHQRAIASATENRGQGEE
jgi:hypothetical protein